MKKRVRIIFPVIGTAERFGHIDVPDDVDPDQWLKDHVDDVIKKIDVYNEAAFLSSHIWFTHTLATYEDDQ